MAWFTVTEITVVDAVEAPNTCGTKAEDAEKTNTATSTPPKNSTVHFPRENLFVMFFIYASIIQYQPSPLKDNAVDNFSFIDS